MKKLFTQFASIFLLVFALLCTGCPKEQVQKNVRDFKEKSATLSVYGEKLITAFGNAFKDGDISKEQLAKLNIGTGAFTKGVGVFREAIAAAETIVKSGQPLPAGTLQNLNAILNEQVIDAFFDILVKLGALSIAQSEVVKTAISTIRLTILAISGALSSALQIRNIGEVPRYATA